MIFKKSKEKTSIGGDAEKAALKYLKSNGLKFVTQNYSCRRGEIDLIMNDGDTLVFVEVRFRKNTNFGSAIETVTESKQNKIRMTAQHYLLEKNIGESNPVRFDVVGIGPENINWIKNAF